MYWNDLNTHLKRQYGCKVYKLALSSGCSCPNRDGTLGVRGCIFCDGAGAFAEAGDIPAQLAAARQRVAAKAGQGAKYIAYFQSFTNTYGAPAHLRRLFQTAIEPEDVAILSIATRPDCLGPEILELLAELNRVKPVWVELGLQTIHPASAAYIRRGYDLPVFDAAVKQSEGHRRSRRRPPDPGTAGGNAGDDGADQPLHWAGRSGRRKAPSPPRSAKYGSSGRVAGGPGADVGIAGIHCRIGAVSPKPAAGGGHPPAHRRRRQAGSALSPVEW